MIGRRRRLGRYRVFVAASRHELGRWPTTPPRWRFEAPGFCGSLASNRQAQQKAEAAGKMALPAMPILPLLR